MNPIPVNLAVEDELSEAVLRRVLGELNRYEIGSVYRRGGFGYLRKTIPGWNNAAVGIPFIALTDLDTAACPRGLIDEWLNAPQHPNLLVRVAVREVESWLLADGAGLADFLRVRSSVLPRRPDDLPDPKRTLLEIARRSRSADLRAALIPKTGSTATQGPDYNGRLAEFIRTSWSLVRACTNSPSLARSAKRLAEFEPVW